MAQHPLATGRSCTSASARLQGGVHPRGMVRLGFWPARTASPETRRRDAPEGGAGDAAPRAHHRAGPAGQPGGDEAQAAQEAAGGDQAQAAGDEGAPRARAPGAGRGVEGAQGEGDGSSWGAGVSGGLEPAHAGRGEAGAPGPADAGHTPEDLAQALGCAWGSCGGFAHRAASTRTNYVRFALPKKTGGERTISAPMPRLKAAQRWVLENVLEKLPVHEAAHGFAAGRSIVTNALAARGRGGGGERGPEGLLPLGAVPAGEGPLRKSGLQRGHGHACWRCCAPSPTRGGRSSTGKTLLRGAGTAAAAAGRAHLSRRDQRCCACAWTSG